VPMLPSGSTAPALKAGAGLVTRVDMMFLLWLLI
jgi:hypothetical protein